MIELLIGHTEL